MPIGRTSVCFQTCVLSSSMRHYFSTESVPSIARKAMPGGGFLAAVLPVAIRFMLEHGATGELTDAAWDALEGRPDGTEDDELDYDANNVRRASLLNVL